MQYENKVGIIIVVYNIRIDLFLNQIECIQRFCRDTFYIEIVDNSDNGKSPAEIKYHCDRLGLNYVKTNAGSSNGTESHVFAANQAFKMFRNKYDYLFFIDHDCFPIKDFSVVDILKDKVMAGLGQGNEIPYFWAGFVMWNNRKVEHNLIDFSANHEFKLDTGGQLWKVIDVYGKDNVVFVNETIHQNNFFNKGFYNFYNMIHNEGFMHFVNSSNWNNSEENDERLNSLVNILKSKIN